MSLNEQEQVDREQDEQASSATGDGADLTEALGDGGETEFITEEKRPVNRTSVMVFGALLLAGGGYYMMYARTGPQTAAAATAEAAQADQTINQFLLAGDENIKVMRQLRQTTDKVVAQFRGAEPAQVPVDDLQANPFKFAQISDAASAAEAAKLKREEERAAALASVQTLQLQSILHGGAKQACMINNQMVVEGGNVAGFTVEKITSGSVVVKTGPYRFELKMQH